MAVGSESGIPDEPEGGAPIMSELYWRCRAGSCEVDLPLLAKPSKLSSEGTLSMPAPTGTILQQLSGCNQSVTTA